MVHSFHGVSGTRQRNCRKEGNDRFLLISVTAVSPWQHEQQAGALN